MKWLQVRTLVQVPSEPPLKTSVYAQVMQLAGFGLRTGHAPRRLRSKSAWQIHFRPQCKSVHNMDLSQDVGGKKMDSPGEDGGTTKQKDSQAVTVHGCRDIGPPLSHSRNSDCHLKPNLLTVCVYSSIFCLLFSLFYFYSVGYRCKVLQGWLCMTNHEQL